jgi:hypothetical protein
MITAIGITRGQIGRTIEMQGITGTMAGDDHDSAPRRGLTSHAFSIAPMISYRENNL